MSIFSRSFQKSARIWSRDRSNFEVPDVVMEELEKISESCLTFEEHKKLANDTENDADQLYRVLHFNEELLKAATEIIGFTELRAVLGFSPPKPWTNSNEIKSRVPANATIEQYYNANESRHRNGILRYSLEDKQVSSAVKFLDKRFPVIRDAYTKSYKHNWDGKKKIDRKIVDYMLDLYDTVYDSIEFRIYDLTRRSKIEECKPKKDT
ncbi:hypothetical protein GCK72_023101 [Caenorhabditis remanei]|uniref:Uncharacterized protein n=1 Tax=Caenorhabditis remanei TaxID=31234 RepID=A0A6A5FVW3_CAERE|nr:hypothetical protein GCK72_023101 [Caenorhabditis remanei]KAF1746644.1 hypothetical protein GCK72_023101 [Caenorhabditis remanei]